MLELRPNCECCDRVYRRRRRRRASAPMNAPSAATAPKGVLGGRCPNCGGELVRRPIRPADRLAAAPGFDAARGQARRLRAAGMTLGPSRRGLVPPFIAMDVLRAANEREAGGRSMSSISKSASPARRRRRRCWRRRAQALDSDRIGYTDALGIAPLREAIARHYRCAVRRCGRPGRDGRHDRLVGRLSAGVSRRVRGRRPGRAGGARLSRLSQHPRGARHRAGTDRGRRERALPAQPRNCSPRPATLAGLIVASPANPTGTMIAAGELARLVEFCRERGIRLVSDEIYHGITYESAAQTARAFGQRGDRRQLVLEILQHDRLAARLDGGAARSRALGRMPGAEFLHFAAGIVAARGGAGVWLPRRTRRPCRALPRQSRSADRRTASRRSDAVSLRPRARSISMSMFRR